MSIVGLFIFTKNFGASFHANMLTIHIFSFDNKFNIKMNYIVLAIFVVILTIVMALLYF